MRMLPSDSRSRSRSPPLRSRRSRFEERFSRSRSRSPRRRRPSRSPPSNPSHRYRSRSPPRNQQSTNEPHQSNRSPSPYGRARSRSLSPNRQKERKSKVANAFKWKDKSAASSNDLPREAKRTEHSNRDQPDKRIDRSPVRDDVKNKFGDDYQSQYARRAGPLEEKVGGDDADNDEREKKRKKEKKRKAAGQQVRQPKPTNEPMIIVNVNNRLGTKSAIPCLASDTISKFTEESLASLFRMSLAGMAANGVL